MMLALIICGCVALAEIALWLQVFWPWRKVLSAALLSLVVISTLVLIASRLSAWTVVFGILALYRIVNLCRVYVGRTQADYLFHEARRTSWRLIALQLLVVGIAGLNSFAQTGVLFWWYLLALVQLTAAAGLFATTRRHLKTTRPPTIEPDGMPDRQLPSLTVCIPARNETDDLEACLTSLVASDYTKLEIIVLDDCSQNKHTPEIIRGFAHDGVRFIAGTPPPEHWLAKNWAYKQLSDEANGELLLFCGVDTRFEKHSLTAMVRTMLQKKKAMLTVVPRNSLPDEHSMMSAIVQTGRYAWELALPRRLLERPPVLSTCWLITKELLTAYGGFASAKQSVLPERHLARKATTQHDGYSLVCSNTTIGLASHKSYAEQRATAIRMRYPQLHRRPDVVALVSMAEFGLLVWPFIILAVSAVLGSYVLTVVSGGSCLLLVVFYGQIMGLTYRQFLGRSIWLLPFAALYDIGLLNYSMRQYEFDEVIWKGRNVCVPVMRVYPSLPKFD